MTYSVWDPVAGMYDYYVTPQGRQLEHDVPKPRHLSGGPEIGLSPDQAAWPLPANAKKVGRGQQAKGMIARAPGGAALGDEGFSVGGLGLGMLLGIGALLYLAFGK